MTTPDVQGWDPASLGGLVSQLVNSLFVPTAVAPAPAQGLSLLAAPSQGSVLPGSVLPGSGLSAAPAQSVPLLSVPSSVLGTSPFSAPLSFDALGRDDLSIRPISLLDRDAAPPNAALPNAALPNAALSSEPAETPAALYEPAIRPPSDGIVFDAYEVTPVTDLALPAQGNGIFDAASIRGEFPILRERIHGKPLVWLDNAATTQKPQAVIDRLAYYYEHENSNVHRAAHTLAARASDAYEAAREAVRRFVNAPSARDVVFVRGATEGINLVAQSWGRRNVAANDEIVISWLEHHANIVPWQQLCAEKGARLRIAPVDDRGQIVLEEYEKLLGPKTRLVAFTQVSNALGTITPAREMIELAHRHGAKVLLDGAQGISHLPVDVQSLDCDFYVFSGHKVFAPTGIGVVVGKGPVLDSMPPWQGGGNMIQDVTFERTSYQGVPARFEAGTANIADAIGLGTALDWLSRIGVENVARYEHELLLYATEQLATVRGLTMIGTAADKAGVLSFVLAGQKTEAVGGLLDKEGIALRSGHHCAQPILRRFGLEATVRASLAPYNNCADIDALVAALHRLQASAPTQG